MTFPQPVGVFLSAASMGFWALLGSIMRGSQDWCDPKTGKVSVWRIMVTGATALVLGQAAVAFGSYMKWEEAAIGFLASFMGWLGPAGTMWIVQKKFLGETDVADK